MRPNQRLDLDPMIGHTCQIMGGTCKACIDEWKAVQQGRERHKTLEDIVETLKEIHRTLEKLVVK